MVAESGARAAAIMQQPRCNEEQNGPSDLPVESGGPFRLRLNLQGEAILFTTQWCSMHTYPPANHPKSDKQLLRFVNSLANTHIIAKQLLKNAISDKLCQNFVKNIITFFRYFSK